MTQRGSIIVFRENVLSYSETFILNQSSRVKKFATYITALEQIDGLQLPENRIILLEEAKYKRLMKFLFKVSGYLPKMWVSRLRKIRPHLIHAHFGMDALWVIPIAKKLSIPLLATFHGYDILPHTIQPTKSYLFYLRNRYKVYLNADKIIAVSKFIKYKLIEDGCPEDKITIHYIGIDTEYFKRDENIRIEKEILYVGRLIDRKGILDLIEALKLSPDCFNSFRLVIIGSGSLESEMIKKLEESKLNYLFLGPQSQEAVRLWMNRAFLFCVPAVDEAFGLVYAEAQSMKVPVVAYNHSGVSEVVVDGETGLLASPNNIPDLNRKIVDVIKNENLRNVMGQSGREKVISDFDINKQIILLEDIYSECMEKYNEGMV